MNNDEHKLIIIGGNHHNTLSVMRCFGKRKINFIVLIHENNKTLEEVMVSHSKYAKNIMLINDDERSILNWLIKNKDTNNKKVIIPCSDLAEYSIDNNYDKLNQYYYISGYTNQPGHVCKMMDKYEQKKWADKNNILMAKSWLLKSGELEKKINDIEYPCIIKPNVSAKGSKGDIVICEDKESFFKCIYNNFKGYDEVIVQQYINKKFELLAMGLITNDNYCKYSGVERKIRETIPGGGGSTALGQFVTEERIINQVNKVLQQLYLDGYRGLYDIEFFECDDKIYLNEINFRHSGSGFALIDNGIETPYLYYLYCLNKKIINTDLKHPNGFFFCDIGEVYLLFKYKTINIFQFLCDFIKSYSKAIFKISDLGVLKFYIKESLKRR